MRLFRNVFTVIAVVASASLLPFSIFAQDDGSSQDSISRRQRLQMNVEMRKNQKENEASTVSEESLGEQTANIVKDAYRDRDMILYIPSHLPVVGQRSMVVALHGGLGNAQLMQEHLKINGLRTYVFSYWKRKESKAEEVPLRFFLWLPQTTGRYQDVHPHCS